MDYYKTLDEAEERGEVADIESVASRHAFHRWSKVFDEAFTVWVGWLTQCLYMKKAGYPFKAGDFSAFEWRCMGLIEILQNNNIQRSHYEALQSAQNHRPQR